MIFAMRILMNGVRRKLFACMVMLALTMPMVKSMDKRPGGRGSAAGDAEPDTATAVDRHILSFQRHRSKNTNAMILRLRQQEDKYGVSGANFRRFNKSRAQKWIDEHAKQLWLQCVPVPEMSKCCDEYYKCPGERGWHYSTGFTVEADSESLIAKLVIFAHNKNELECLRKKFRKVAERLEKKLEKNKWMTRDDELLRTLQCRKKIMDRWIMYLTEMMNHSRVTIRYLDGKKCKRRDRVVAEQDGEFYPAIYVSSDHQSRNGKNQEKFIKCRCDNGQILHFPAENVSKALDSTNDFSIPHNFQDADEDDAWKKLVSVINKFDKYQILVRQIGTDHGTDQVATEIGDHDA